MPYLEDVKEFFDRQVRELFIENQNPFQNGFESSIFYLIKRLLDEQTNGAFFIKVPMRELGSLNHVDNYANFCGSVLFAAGMKVYQENNINPTPEIMLGDYFYKRIGPNRIFIKHRRGYLSINELDVRDPAIYGQPGEPGHAPKLIAPIDYPYNQQNGTRSINAYFRWLNLFIPSIQQKVLNGNKGRILIISHAEIERGLHSNSIPFSTVNENGTFSYSSPIEPLVYLARDRQSDVLEEMVRSKKFETIICIGDKNFQTGGVWDVATGYFKKIIYVGGNSPLNPIQNYYTYSIQEMHKLYDVDCITFENKICINAGLDQAVNTLKNKILEIRARGGNFNHTMVSFYNMTAPLDDGNADWHLNAFENKLLTDLVSNNGNDFQELRKSYFEIINILRNGNQEKIRIVQEIILQQSNNTKVFCIVNNNPEITTFRRILNLKETQFITRNSFDRKIRKNIVDKKQKNVFIFLAFDDNYINGIVHLLDKYSICGERIFISFSETDIRFDNILKRSKKLAHDLVSGQDRFEIIGIEYEQEIDPVNFELTIDDFGFDDVLNYRNADYAPKEGFIVTFIDGTHVTLSGRVVVEEEIIDISEVEIGSEIAYYQNDDEIFDQIWQVYQPNLAVNIPLYSTMWKEALDQLNTNYHPIRGLFDHLIENGWNTSLANLRGLLREQNETDFPIRSSLEAIRNLCRTTPGTNELAFVTQFQPVLNAKRANELRKGLGNKLSTALMERVCGIDPTDLFIMRLQEGDLFNQAFENCIIRGTIQNIQRI